MSVRGRVEERRWLLKEDLSNQENCIKYKFIMTECTIISYNFYSIKKKNFFNLFQKLGDLIRVGGDSFT